MGGMTTLPETLAIAVQHHQAGRLQEAEALYRQVLLVQPEHPDALHLLGVIAHQSGRHDAAVEFIVRAIALNPEAAEYHNNIGEVYRAQGKQEEAIAHYRKALALKPDYADAYNNLGLALAAQGKLEEAVAHYRQALALRPVYADAHSNLGVAFQSLCKREEANAHFESAVALNPNSFQLRYNFGRALMEQGMPEKAMQHYRQALAQKPGFFPAVNDYAAALLQTGEYELMAGFIASLHKLPAHQVNQDQVRGLHVLLAVVCYLRGEFDRCRDNLVLGKLDTTSPDDFPNRRVLAVYRNFLAGLLGFYEANRPLYRRSFDARAECHAVGDSHCLSPAWTAITLQGERHRVVPHMVTGCKAWHLAKDGSSLFKQWFHAIYERLPTGAPVVCAIGEIDCRVNDGILPFYKKHPERELLGIIRDTVERYVACVSGLMLKKGIRLYLQGVPAPHRDIIGKSGQDGEMLVRIVREFNRALIESAGRYGCPVIDVYGMTAAQDGISNGRYHLDRYHLRPDYLEEALAKYLASSAGSLGGK